MKFKLLGLLGLGLVGAIFEKHKGLNEWSIENLGKLRDLKFVEKPTES